MPLPPADFNQKRWNRTLIRGYWVVFGLTLGLELLYMFFVTELSKSEFLLNYLLLPSLLMAAVVVSAEACVKFMTSKYHDYMLITASALLTVIVTAIHTSLEYLLFFLFFPIMISIFYFQIKKLTFAVVISFATLYILYIFNPDIHERFSLVGLLSTTTLLGAYSAIAFGVLARGREALQHLRSSYESNQELLVRNILMDKLAKTDALTDTYNHMAYHEFVEKLVEQAEKGLLELTIAVMDIDNFKKINDSYGHRAGDAVLRDVAATTRSKVGPNDFVARYGGEEFVILFTELDYDCAFNQAELIRQAIADTTHESIDGHAITVSVGVNRYISGMGKERFFQGADAALYEAKHTGKNRTVAAEAMRGQSLASAIDGL